MTTSPRWREIRKNSWGLYSRSTDTPRKKPSRNTRISSAAIKGSSDKTVQVSFPSVRRIRSACRSGLRWKRGVRYIFLGTIFIVTALVAVGFHHVYFDQTNLPDIGPFTRFEFPSIGHIYDANGQPLVELAKEYRRVIQYEDIPPIVRD